MRSTIALSFSSAARTGRKQPSVASTRTHWVARLSAVVVWAAVGFAVAMGLLRWTGQAPPVALPAQPRVSPEVDVQAVSRALGGVPAIVGPAAPAPDATGRYVLVGVVAEGGGGLSGSAHRRAGGVALITVDGQRARPYAVGAVVDGRWVVHQVSQREVQLRASDARDNGPSLTLVLPKL